MNRSLLIVVAGVLLFVASGCANECDDLQDKCDACGNAGTKANCQALVDASDGDACQIAIDAKTYEGVQCM